MAFVHSVKEMFSQAGQSAKGLSDIAKLNHIISSTEEQINELYGKIGYSIYCKYASAPLPEVEDMIKQVNVLHAQINECKAQITAINNADTCPHCGGKINRNSAFCPNCGGKIEGAIKKPAQAPVQQAPVVQAPAPAQVAPAVTPEVTPVVAPAATPAVAPAATPEVAPAAAPVVEVAPAASAAAPAQKAIAFCSNCGAPLASDSVFCMNCGNKVV